MINRNVEVKIFVVVSNEQLLPHMKDTNVKFTNCWTTSDSLHNLEYKVKVLLSSTKNINKIIKLTNILDYVFNKYLLTESLTKNRHFFSKSFSLYFFIVLYLPINLVE